MWSDREPAGQVSVRPRKHDVLATWRRLVIREDPDLARLDAATLIVPIEAVFDRMIDCLEGGAERRAALKATVTAHADDRFRAGLPIDSILRELESSDVDVDRLAEQVARAAELIGLCRDRISAARIRIDEVIADLDGGDASDPTPQSR